MPQYKSHIHVTKGAIQSVVDFTKEILHGNLQSNISETNIVPPYISPGNRVTTLVIQNYAFIFLQVYSSIVGGQK